MVNETQGVTPTTATLATAAPVTTAEAVTIKHDVFSCAATSAPACFYPGIALSRKVDFSKTNVDGTSMYDILGLPRSFILCGIFIKEYAKATSTDLTFYLKSATSTALNTAIQIGRAAFDEGKKDYRYFTTIGASGFAPSFINSDNGDELCFKSSQAATEGKIEITALGYLPDADSMDKVETPKYVLDNNMNKSAVCPNMDITNTSNGDVYPFVPKTV